MKIAFIGLGVMGYPMAGHLQAAGHPVTVYNRSPDKAKRWQATYAGQVASSIAGTVRGANLVITCVGADPDLQEVYLGERGILAQVAPHTLLIDHTTASAEIARQLAQAAMQKGCDFIDAPVSGGQKGAETGTLTIMCGGLPQAFQRAEPILLQYAKAVTWMGDAGAGQLTKMVNQITIAGLIQSLAEGIHFAESAGLDVQKVLQVISKGAAQSWQMDNRGQTMLEGRFDFGFAVDWMRKDLALCLQEGRKNGARLPVAALVDQFYADIQAANGGRLDTSSLLKRLR